MTYILFKTDYSTTYTVYYEKEIHNIFPLFILFCYSCDEKFERTSKRLTEHGIKYKRIRKSFDKSVVSLNRKFIFISPYGLRIGIVLYFSLITIHYVFNI